MSNKLTEKEAYMAMYDFLETYFKLLDSDVLAMLLSGLSLTDGEKSLDAAMQENWLKAVEKAKNGDVNINLDLS